MKLARGFTLMEVLVALVLLTMFTLVTYRSLDTVLVSQRQVSAEMEHWREMAAAFVWLDSDLSNAVTRLNPREPSGSVFHTRTETDGAMQFDMVRLLSEDADEGLQRVGYRCAEKRLLRLVWPEVDNGAVVPKEFALLQGLTFCGFRYLDIMGAWSAAWLPQVQQPLPRAVELSLVEASGITVRRVWRVQ